MSAFTVEIELKRIRLKRAILLSRNDWHLAAVGAVLSTIPGAPKRRSEILPRRPCGRDGASVVTARGLSSTKRRISMSKSAKKSPAASVAPVFVSKSSQQSVVDPKSNSIDPDSKQSRVIAMLQSPAGATIASMMEVTGWQPHSVRGFLAGVVRKRLKLKLGSKKVDGTRVYQITSNNSRKSGHRQFKRRSH